MSRSFLVAQMLGETIKLADFPAEFKRPLNESQTAIADEPLEKTYKQYVLNGKSYSPVGDVTLSDSLKAYAYEINLTPTGPQFVRVKPLTDDLMIFENSAMRKVVEEIDKFWQRKEHYNKLGLMHNRGILMFGPPGTGKSCALQQVVEMMVKRGDVVFFAKSPSAILEGLRAFRDVEPDRRVVVCFEEADELAQYDERKLLQLMDGDCKIDNTLFLATTNYIERLSPRMLRPGRFDKKVYIGTPSLEARRHYLTKKLNAITDSKMIEHLAKQSEGMGFGHLRELIAGIFAIGDPVEEVLDRLREKPIVERSPATNPTPTYYRESQQFRPGRQLLESVTIDYTERLKRLKQRRDPDNIERNERSHSHRS